MSEIDWMPVKNNANKVIGAVGFIGDEAVIIASLFDDRDLDQDGKVSFGEKVKSLIPLIGSDGAALAEVGKYAAHDMDLMMRDTQIRAFGYKQFTAYANNLIREGIYITYFQRPISIGSGTLASHVTTGVIKQIAVKQTAKAAVGKAMKSALGL